MIYLFDREMIGWFELLSGVCSWERTPVKQGMQVEEERKEEERKEEEEEEGGEIGNFLEELPRQSPVTAKCLGNKEPQWFGPRSSLHSLPGLFWLHKCVLLPLRNRSLHSFRLLALLLSSL